MAEMLSYYESLDDLLAVLKKFIEADIDLTFRYAAPIGRFLIFMDQLEYKKARKKFPKLCTTETAKAKYGATLYLKIGKAPIILTNDPAPAPKAPAKGRKKKNG